MNFYIVLYILYGLWTLFSVVALFRPYLTIPDKIISSAWLWVTCGIIIKMEWGLFHAFLKITKDSVTFETWSWYLLAGFGAAIVVSLAILLQEEYLS